MRFIILFFLPFTSFATGSIISINTLVKDLYSNDFKIRSGAASKLSAAESSEDISKIIEAFETELLCTKNQSRPKTCHDPKFIYNAILIAGNLAVRSPQAPWNFLVYLWKGNSIPASQEGSFFARSDDPENDHRNNTFTPYRSALQPTAAELEAFLVETINKADIWASCKWSLNRLAKFSQKKAVTGYQIYSYTRNYSPLGQYQHQYQNRNDTSWIYQGERRISCNTASDIFVDKHTNKPFGFSIKNASEESLNLDVSLFALPEANLLCSYTIRYGGADPLKAADLNPDKFFRTFFDFDLKKCNPKEVTGYQFVKKP